MTLLDPARGFWNPEGAAVRRALRELGLQSGDQLILITRAGRDTFVTACTLSLIPQGGAVQVRGGSAPAHSPVSWSTVYGTG